MRHFGILVSAMLAMQAIASGANAFSCANNPAKWRVSNNQVTLRMDANYFPEQSPQALAFRYAAQTWNDGPANFHFVVRGGDESVEYGNRQNEVSVSADPSIVGGTYAITLKTVNCDRAEILEADVLFNAIVPWTMSHRKYDRTSYGGSGIPFGAAAVHELGHVLGLSDILYANTIMNSLNYQHTNGSFVYSYPGEIAADLAVFLYGTDPARRQDVSVSHWKFVAPGLFPMRTGIYGHWPLGNTPWLETTGTVGNHFSAYYDTVSEPRFNVHRGQTIWPEFTFENNGADTQEFDVGFYLSTNDAITRDDRQIGKTRLRLTRDMPFTTAYPVTIPTDLEIGADYYLGVIVDVGDEVNELPGLKFNGTYTAIRVKKAYPASLILTPDRLDGGQTTHGICTLYGIAGPGGVTLHLEATDDQRVPVADLVTVDDLVTVPEGHRSVVFEVRTKPIPGEGYKLVELRCVRGNIFDQPGGIKGAWASLYIKRYGQHHPDQTFCEANPYTPLCALCDERPDAPGCGSLSGLTNEDMYISRQSLEDMRRPRSGLEVSGPSRDR